MSQATNIENASIQATRKFWSFLREIPGIWKPEVSQDYMRFWAIDESGTVVRVPAEALEGFGKRVAKDTYAISAMWWCRQNRPDAVILGMECWVAGIAPEHRERLLAREGGTPDLMVPENRERLIRLYGAKISQRIVLQGECRGLPKPVFRAHEIEGENIGADVSAGMEGFRSRYAGILLGTLEHQFPADEAGFR